MAEFERHLGIRPGLLNMNSRKKYRKSHEILRFRGFLWQGQKDSNPRHSVLETDALPAELYPCVVGLQGLEPGTDRL